MSIGGSEPEDEDDVPTYGTLLKTGKESEPLVTPPVKNDRNSLDRCDSPSTVLLLDSRKDARSVRRPALVHLLTDDGLKDLEENDKEVVAPKKKGATDERRGTLAERNVEILDARRLSFEHGDVLDNDNMDMGLAQQQQTATVKEHAQDTLTPARRPALMLAPWRRGTVTTILTVTKRRRGVT